MVLDFDRYANKHQFEKFLNNTDFCNKAFGLPQVIEYQGEYYVIGNRNHRLTIAK